MVLYNQSNFELIGRSVQEEKFNINFQDGSHGDHLGFPIRTTLATSELQVTSVLPMEFRVCWPLGSGEKVQKRFSTWLTTILDFRSGGF